MAKTTVITCDYTTDEGATCHKPATVKFTTTSSEGVTYEVDFCDAHRDAFEALITRVGSSPQRAIVNSKARSVHLTRSGRSFTVSEARSWLAANGHEVSVNGRISKELLQVFAEAH